MQYKNIGEVAEVIRTSQNSLLRPGTSYIRLSANNGAVGFLQERQELGNGYVAFIPREKIIGKYLYYQLEYEMPGFLARYKSGINLNFETIKFLKIRLISIQEQREFVKRLEILNEQQKQEEQEIARLQEYKRALLQLMFPR